jgi:carbon storage regulator CsrA
MLVLTRKHQEKIRIGDHIVITVLKTKGKSVRLGIEAPNEVSVIRGELSFEGHSVQWQDEASDVEPETASAETSRTERVRQHWPTKPEVNRVASHPVRSGGSQVSLKRISRDQMAQILPKALGESGPLRAMLNRRSVSA